MPENLIETPTNNVNEEIEKLVQYSKKALENFMNFDQQKIDEIVHKMAIAGVKNHVRLAKISCEETLRGIVEDKIIKNLFATENIWNSIKNQKTVGEINDPNFENFVEIAEPIGVIAGVTPVTNPTSTTMFKSLICVKTRNPIIFGFHPSAQQCSVEAAKIMQEAAIKAGAPEHCIGWIETPSIEATNYLMNHKGVSLVLATGGSAMVKSAYSTGKPALGVGPGNVPCYIEKTADLSQACTDLILSKTFDNGMICASEQSVIVDEEIQGKFERFMRVNGCYFLSEKETELLSNLVFNHKNKMLNGQIVGKNAHFIAAQAGINVPQNTKILIAALDDVGIDFPLSIEKLSPILAYYIVKSHKKAFEIAKKVLNFSGLGHTAVMHSNNHDLIKKFGKTMEAGRIIVNSPSTHGAIGDIYNVCTPSLTLGCGSYGKNSTTDNISAKNLINIKRVFKRKNNMQWFKVPNKIFFGENSVEYLQKLRNFKKVFVVSDKTMLKLGYVDKVSYYLNKRDEKCEIRVFDDVEPDPSVQTVLSGAEIMKNFNPDTIIAIGGGSVIDAAKGMWLFYEYPELLFENLKLKFMDIEKRVCNFPKLGSKAQFIAIPTTSGTGSEVTAFTVITDKQNAVKYPIADYSLTPTISIIDSQFVLSLPKAATADTGLDVLTHAIEAYVSVMASDYTDGLALQAIEMVFEYLPRAYKFGDKDKEAREKMHNASTIAGMAFTNAFLGLNHSMAHNLGGAFHITHGRANSLLLPHIIEYNCEKPTKFSAFPKYKKFVADKKYVKIAQLIGRGGKTTKESIINLISAIRELQTELKMPLTIKECGVDENEFFEKIYKLAENAHADQCTGTNPRYPLISEIKEIYAKAYK